MHPVKKNTPSTNGAGETGYLHVKECKQKANTIHLTQNSSQEDQDLSIKSGTHKLEEGKGGNSLEHTAT